MLIGIICGPQNWYNWVQYSTFVIFVDPLGTLHGPPVKKLLSHSLDFHLMNGRTGERRFNSDWRNPVVPVYVGVALRKVTTLASTPRIQWIEGNLVGVNFTNHLF